MITTSGITKEETTCYCLKDLNQGLPPALHRKSDGKNGLVDCLTTTSVPLEYFDHTTTRAAGSGYLVIFCGDCCSDRRPLAKPVQVTTRNQPPPHPFLLAVFQPP